MIQNVNFFSAKDYIPITYMPDLSVSASYDSQTIYPTFRYTPQEVRQIIGGVKMKNEKPKEQEEKKAIYLDRNDSYDRAIINGGQLEPGDVFRLPEDKYRKIYMVIDMSDVLDEDTVDDNVIYALDVAKAKVVAFNNDIQVNVYDPDGVKFRTGSFIQDYGEKENNV